MHEFIPELRRVPSDTNLADQDDEYEIYNFWPSRNEIQRSTFASEWDYETGTESTFSDYSMIASPTFSIDAGAVFTDTVDDVGISEMGYSRFYRTGLWAQSSRITRRLDAFIARAVAKFHSLKRRFTRHSSTRPAS